MKKILLLLLVISFSTLSALTKLDSLRLELDKSKGKERISILDTIQKEYLEIYPKASLQYGIEALALSRQLNDRQSEVNELINIAHSYRNLEEYDTALQYLHKSLAKANQLDDKKIIIEIQLDISKQYADNFNSSKAFQFAINANKLSEEIQFKEGIARSNFLMGDIYLMLGEINDAQVLFERSLQNFDDQKQPISIGRIYEKLAIINLENNELKMAEENFQKGLIYHNNANNTEGLIRCYEKLAAMMKDQGRTRAAQDYYQKLYHYNQELELKLSRNMNLYLYEYHNAQGERKRAIEYLQLYEAQQDSLKNFRAKKSFETHYQKIITELIENYHEEKTDIQDKHEKDLTMKNRQIVKTQKENIKKIEELKRLEKETILQKKIFQIENQKKKDQIEKLQAEKELKDLKISQKIRERNFLIFSSAIFIVLLILFYLNFHQKRELSKVLEKKNQYLTELTKELMEKEKELERQAKTDYLTELPNRNAMAEKLKHEKYRFLRNKNPFSLIISDIDDFKKINDNYGHDFGDFVLSNIAKLIKKTIRKQDVCARWGGEEFLFLLPETDEKGSAILAEKVRKSIEKFDFEFNEQKIHCSMTFGTSVFRKDITIDKCLKEADNALYHGKNTGKNKVVKYSLIKDKN